MAKFLVNTQACIANERQRKFRYVRGREKRSKYVRIDYEANEATEISHNFIKRGDATLIS